MPNNLFRRGHLKITLRPTHSTASPRLTHRLETSSLRFLFLLVQLIVLGVASEQRALAYVDPGSGLLAFQLGGSILAGLFYALRRKLLRIFRCSRETSTECNSRRGGKEV